METSTSMSAPFPVAGKNGSKVVVRKSYLCFLDSQISVDNCGSLIHEFTGAS